MGLTSPTTTSPLTPATSRRSSVCHSRARQRRAQRQRHVARNAAVLHRGVRPVRHIHGAGHPARHVPRQVEGAHVGRRRRRWCASAARRRSARAGRSGFSPAQKRRAVADVTIATGAARQILAGERPSRLEADVHHLEVVGRDHVQPEQRRRLRCRNRVALDVERPLGHGAGQRQRVHERGAADARRRLRLVVERAVEGEAAVRCAADRLGRRDRWRCTT